jgi:hypothetical protein
VKLARTTGHDVVSEKTKDYKLRHLRRGIFLSEGITYGTAAGGEANVSYLPELNPHTNFTTKWGFKNKGLCFRTKFFRCDKFIGKVGAGFSRQALINRGGIPP